MDKQENNEALELQYLRAELQRTKKELKRLKKLCAKQEEEKDALEREREAWELAYARIAHSEAWRLTKPIIILPPALHHKVMPYMKSFPTAPLITAVRKVPGSNIHLVPQL